MNARRTVTIRRPAQPAGRVERQRPDPPGAAFERDWRGVRAASASTAWRGAPASRSSVVFERVSPGAQRPRTAGLPVRLPAAPPQWKPKAAAAGGLLAAVVLLAAACQFFVAPSSTVVVAPNVEEFPIDVTVRIDPDIGSVDLERGLVPATIVDATAEGALQKPTSGRRRVAQTVATGFVTIRNRTRQAVVLPAGSRVLAADRTGFLTDAEILVPPTLQVGGRDVPGEAVVAVTAELPGIEGNAPALAIIAVDGDVGAALEAFNPQPLQGGTEREVSLVDQRDLDELDNVLTERLLSSAVERLRRDRSANQTLIVWSPAAGNPQVLQREFSADLGQRANAVTLGMAIRAQGTAFATEDLRAVLLRRVEAAAPDGGTHVDDIRITNTEVLGERQGVLDIRVLAVAEAHAHVDHGQVRDAVAGRELIDGLRSLRDVPGVRDVSVAHDPPDTANFPRLGFRIDVQVESPAHPVAG